MNTELINKKVEYWENQLLDLGKRNKGKKDWAGTHLEG